MGSGREYIKRLWVIVIFDSDSFYKCIYQSYIHFAENERVIANWKLVISWRINIYMWIVHLLKNILFPKMSIPKCHFDTLEYGLKEFAILKAIVEEAAYMSTYIVRLWNYLRIFGLVYIIICIEFMNKYY